MNAEIAVRLGVFAGVFIVLAVAEVLMPRRTRNHPRLKRWFANIVLVALNPVSVRLLFPFLPVGLAVMAGERNWGLLNNVDLPYWGRIAIGVLALDLAVYLQHVWHHAIPLLWRLHMVHHSDLDFDLTTGAAISPDGDRGLHGLETHGGLHCRASRSRRPHLRGGPERDVHVQPQQHSLAVSA